MEAVQGSVVRGEGARCRRTVPGSTRTGSGVVRGRENPDPGPQSDPAGVPDAAGHPGAGQPRLRPPRYLKPVRRVRSGLGQGHRLIALSAPIPGVPGVFEEDRRRSPRRVGLSRRARQRLHSQNPGGETLADQPSTVRAAFHPNQLILAQPRGTLVCRADHQETTPRHPHLGPSAQRRHPKLDQHLERQPPPLRLDQDRRPNPGQHRQLLPTN